MNAASEIVAGTPPTPTSSDGSVDLLPDIRAKEPSFLEVFLAWERLRLIYNAVLTILVATKIGADIVEFMPQLSEAAFVANLCFCAGPVFEGYLCWMTMRRIVARYLVFSVGMWAAIFYAVNVVDLIVNNIPVFPRFPNGVG